MAIEPMKASRVGKLIYRAGPGNTVGNTERDRPGERPIIRSAGADGADHLARAAESRPGPIRLGADLSWPILTPSQTGQRLVSRGLVCSRDRWSAGAHGRRLAEMRGEFALGFGGPISSWGGGGGGKGEERGGRLLFLVRIVYRRLFSVGPLSLGLVEPRCEVVGLVFYPHERGVVVVEDLHDDAERVVFRGRELRAVDGLDDAPHLDFEGVEVLSHASSLGVDGVAILVLVASRRGRGLVGGRGGLRVARQQARASLSASASASASSSSTSQPYRQALRHFLGRVLQLLQRCVQLALLQRDVFDFLCQVALGRAHLDQVVVQPDQELLLLEDFAVPLLERLHGRVEDLGRREGCVQYLYIYIYICVCVCACVCFGTA